MTIEELISELKQYDPNLPLCFFKGHDLIEIDHVVLEFYNDKCYMELY